MMATNNTGFNVGLLLSIVCLGIVFVGGWYFQSSLVELRTQMIAQQDGIVEQKTKVEEQAQTIQQLQETVRQQNKQLGELQILLGKRQHPLQVSNTTRCALLRVNYICCRIMTPNNLLIPLVGSIM